MLQFLAANWGTLVIGLAVAAVIVLVICKLRRDKKGGKASCGCGCKNCPSAGMCHSHKK